MDCAVKYDGAAADGHCVRSLASVKGPLAKADQPVFRR